MQLQKLWAICMQFFGERLFYTNEHLPKQQVLLHLGPVHHPQRQDVEEDEWLEGDALGAGDQPLARRHVLLGTFDRARVHAACVRAYAYFFLLEPFACSACTGMNVRPA